MTDKLHLDLYREMTWAVMDVKAILFRLLKEAPETLQDYDHDLYCHLELWLTA